MVFQPQKSSDGYPPEYQQGAKYKCGAQQRQTAYVEHVIFVIHLIAEPEKRGLHAIHKDHIHERDSRIHQVHFPIYGCSEVEGEVGREQVIQKTGKYGADAIPCSLPR